MKELKVEKENSKEYILVAEEIKNIIKKRLEEIYGENIPEKINERVQKELEIVFNNNISNQFLVLHKIVKKANQDGYIVGIRGCLGGSYLAYLLDIVEINPIKLNIPYQTSFKTDGSIDIEIDIAGEYIDEIYTQIGNIFNKEKILKVNLRRIVVLPKDTDISNYIDPEDIDYTSSIPAISSDKYYSFRNEIFSINILDSEECTLLKRLEERTGIDVKKIQVDDDEAQKILTLENIKGISVFESTSVKKILKVVRPQTYEDLIKVLNFTYGTDIWENNMENMITEKGINLKEAISSREDILIYLIEKEVDEKVAFEIMEIVRKGKTKKEKEKWKKYVEIMRGKNIPKWYIEVCEKIKYLFPKAHTAINILNKYRIAYFKENYPLEFYSEYYNLTNKNKYSQKYLLLSKKELIEKLEEVRKKNDSNSYNEKCILRILLEFKERNYEFLDIDENKSDMNKFLIENGKIRIPLDRIYIN